jgi:MFS family permease
LEAGLFRFSEAIAWTSIFPYVYFMVQDFGDTGQSDPAFAAGLMVASFTFCEFLSSLVWSRVSDRIGRKVTLLIGALCGIVSAISFGFSKSIAMAVASRIFGGLTNPNVGVIQTCVGELIKVKMHQGLFP